MVTAGRLVRVIFRVESDLAPEALALGKGRLSCCCLVLFLHFAFFLLNLFFLHLAVFVCGYRRNSSLDVPAKREVIFSGGGISNEQAVTNNCYMGVVFTKMPLIA